MLLKMFQITKFIFKKHSTNRTPSGKRKITTTMAKRNVKEKPTKKPPEKTTPNHSPEKVVLILFPSNLPLQICNKLFYCSSDLLEE